MASVLKLFCLFRTVPMDRFSPGIVPELTGRDITEDICASFRWFLPADRSLN